MGEISVNNLFATYYDDDQIVTAYFMNGSRTVRIVEEPFTALAPRAEDVGSVEKICEPALRLVGQEYYCIPNGSDDGLTAVTNGMCFILRLSDGRLIVVDSGYHASYDGEPDYLIRNLKEMSPDPNHVTIAAWIFTHAHSDHAGGFADLAADGVLSKGIIQVEHIIFNFETVKEYTYGDDVEMGVNFARISFKNTATKLITAHTGGAKALYQAINAKIALWPTGNIGFQSLYTNARNKTPMDLATDVFVAGFAQHTIPLPYTPVGNKQAAIDQALADRAIVAKESMERNLNAIKK